MNLSFVATKGVCNGMIMIESCTQWCMEQHFINDYKFIWLLIISFIMFTIHNITQKTYEDNKEKKEHTENNEILEIISVYSKRVAYTLLLSFLIVWYVQTRYGLLT